VSERRECKSVADLEIRQISDQVWRIGNSANDEGSPDKILGVIQRCGDAFQVFAMASRGPDPIFEGWDDALASFLTPATDVSAPAET
jgi:hypothetical protein